VVERAGPRVTSSYTVHEASLDDLPALAELRWMMCEEQLCAPPGTRDAYETALARVLRENMAGGSCRCWLAQDGQSRLVGAVTLWSFPLLPRPGVTRELHGWVSNLFTRPEHRRRGVARLLLTHLATAASARDVTRLILDPAPGTEPVYAGLGYGTGLLMEAEIGPPPLASIEPA
jgi:GNAT superfamily N-acetyltransferase